MSHTGGCLSCVHQDGLKEENIVVFMYDDIALDLYSPLSEIIINSSDGVNVYQGVPNIGHSWSVWSAGSDSSQAE
ncbi:hypothetical protein O6H91_Y116100 [Diphasiastrum complanatum]|nr:hypothetical protein O6H91_Y116100 [Diphasiastrum complanatum]